MKNADSLKTGVNFSKIKSSDYDQLSGILSKVELNEKKADIFKINNKNSSNFEIRSHSMQFGFTPNRTGKHISGKIDRNLEYYRNKKSTGGEKERLGKSEAVGYALSHVPNLAGVGSSNSAAVNQVSNYYTTSRNLVRRSEE